MKMERHIFVSVTTNNRRRQLTLLLRTMRWWTSQGRYPPCKRISARLVLSSECIRHSIFITEYGMLLFPTMIILGGRAELMTLTNAQTSSSSKKYLAS